MRDEAQRRWALHLRDIYFVLLHSSWVPKNAPRAGYVQVRYATSSRGGAEKAILQSLVAADFFYFIGARCYPTLALGGRMYARRPLHTCYCTVI